jgi:hypothetical protein
MTGSSRSTRPIGSMSHLASTWKNVGILFDQIVSVVPSVSPLFIVVSATTNRRVHKQQQIVVYLNKQIVEYTNMMHRHALTVSNNKSESSLKK